MIFIFGKVNALKNLEILRRAEFDYERKYSETMKSRETNKTKQKTKESFQ